MDFSMFRFIVVAVATYVSIAIKRMEVYKLLDIEQEE